jgi:CrcB protein
VLLVAIFVGGAAGTLTRAGLVRALPFDGHGWPWATFAANLSGTLVLAYLLVLLPRSRYRRGLVGTGFCAALTTFSTFQVELIDLARDGSAGLAAGYAGASLVAALGIVRLASLHR